uniref:HMA domain-containing protein n=1 Tax=Arion vulgaris TaxID=1028688 RepID=A0A0B7AJS9_9EUPU
MRLVINCTTCEGCWSTIQSMVKKIDCCPKLQGCHRLERDVEVLIRGLNKTKVECKD